jgi:hypothetical protein
MEGHTHSRTHTLLCRWLFSEPLVRHVAPFQTLTPPPPHVFQRSDAQLFQTGQCIFLMSSVHTWEYSHYKTIVALEAIKLNSRHTDTFQAVVQPNSVSKLTEPDSRPTENMDLVPIISSDTRKFRSKTKRVINVVILLTSTKC